MSDTETLYKVRYTWLAGHRERYVLAKNKIDIREWFNDTYRITNCELEEIEPIDDRVINLIKEDKPDE